MFGIMNKMGYGGIFLLSFDSIDSIGKFYHIFPDEDACIKALMNVKWPNGFRCSRCGHQTGYRLARRSKIMFQCASCRNQESLTVGTLMEKSSTSLHKWFLAIYHISHGCSALELRNHLSVTYKTAWTIASKIRSAISDYDSEQPLSGHVKVSGAVYNVHLFWYTFLHKKQIPVIVGTATAQPEHIEPTRVKIKLMDRTLVKERDSYEMKPEAIHSFIHAHIDAQHAVVSSSERSSLYLKGYNSLKLFATDAHTWICDTFKGIGLKRLQFYLDEFCFRESLLLQKRPLFDSFFQVCTGSRAISYRNLVRRKHAA